MKKMASGEAAKDLLEPIVEAVDADAASAVSTVAALAAPLDIDAWQVIPVRVRLDAETQPDFMTQIHSALADGCRRIALDLTQNQFFSLNAIQLCVSLARDLTSDGGALALVGCAERTKKHFDVYGSLRQIMVVRTLGELLTEGSPTSLVIRPRSSQEVR